MSDSNIQTPQPSVPAVEISSQELVAEETLTPQSEGGSEGVTYVTPQQFAELEARLLQQVERTAQSFADKNASRLDKRYRDEIVKLNTAVETLKSQGISVSDEQVRAARQAAFDRVLQEDDAISPPSPGQPTPSQNGIDPGVPQPQADPITSFVKNSMASFDAQYGVEVLPTDPEAEGMEAITNPYEFLKRYEAAAQAKAQRMAVPPQARVASPIAGAQNAPSTLQAAIAELESLNAKPRLENIQRMRQLQEIIAKAGG